MALWIKFCSSKAEADGDRAALERDALRDLPAEEVSMTFECHPSPFDMQLRTKSGQLMLVALVEVPDHPNKKWWHEWLERKGWTSIPKPMAS